MLEEIVKHKRAELAETMGRTALSQLLDQIPDQRPPSFEQALTRPNINIIAEIKYRSPSRGAFSCRVPPVELARIYLENGAAALSVLTEKHYFDGDLRFLEQIRQALPGAALLRKDFIVDRYQVAEARLKGAASYLLIVSCLTRGELEEMIACGRDLDLEPLVEVHDAFELESAVESGSRIIGVNNRSLHTFEVDVNVSFEIARRMEKETSAVLVSESGIGERSQILELKDAGFAAFLIGSTLMDSNDPAQKLRELLGEDRP